MALHLVTGYAGKEHVTSADQGAFHMAMLMDGSHVLNRGKKFEASIVSNNLIKVLDGEIIFQGRYIRQGSGEYEEVTIENGTQDYKRNDLIVLRYTKSVETSVENVSLAVIKGTPSIDEATDPEYTQGNLENGDLVADFPLYRVPLNGLNVGELVPLFEVLKDNLDKRIKATEKIFEGIINGTTPAGDSLKLGGKEPSEYAEVLAETKNVYVSPSGSDETGDGTQENPWGTIQKAVDECPSVRHGKTCDYNIFLDNGTYNEDIQVNYDTIRMSATNSEPNITMGTVRVRYSRLEIGFPFTIDATNKGSVIPLRIDYNSSFASSGMITILGNESVNYGILVKESNATLIGTTVSNVKTALSVQQASVCALYYDNNINDCVKGLSADGGIIIYQNATFTNVTTQIHTACGGRVYTGAQNNKGTYTGNGSSTSRTINTGGHGNVAVIYTGITTALVTYGGHISSSNNTVIRGTDANINDGIIKLSTNHASLNASGTVYTYDVLN